MIEVPQHETALDSDQQQVGGLYAKALLGSAGESAEEIVRELEAVVSECLTQHPGLEQALASPRISQEQKEAMLDRIFNGRIHTTLLSFLKILCRRGRIDSLRSIQTVSTELLEQKMGRQRVLVTSAQPLTDEQRELIRSSLSKAFSIDAVLTEKIDANLLGGIVLRIGDKVYDGSMLGRLQMMHKSVSISVQRAMRDSYESLLSS